MNAKQKEKEEAEKAAKDAEVERPVEKKKKFVGALFA